MCANTLGSNLKAEKGNGNILEHLGQLWSQMGKLVAVANPGCNGSPNSNIS